MKRRSDGSKLRSKPAPDPLFDRTRDRLQETQVFVKVSTPPGINLPCQSHFQTASPNLVSPRSSPSTCLPTRSCVHRFLLGYPCITIFSAYKAVSTSVNIKTTRGSRHMIFDLANEWVLRSIHIERRLRRTMSRIPENLFAISEPIPSQPYGSKEPQSVRSTLGTSVPFFHRRTCPFFLQVLVFPQIFAYVCVRIESQ